MLSCYKYEIKIFDYDFKFLRFYYLNVDYDGYYYAYENEATSKFYLLRMSTNTLRYAIYEIGN